ncbi:hypothetical protein D3C81_2190070 [compost metagenome]
MQVDVSQVRRNDGTVNHNDNRHKELGKRIEPRAPYGGDRAFAPFVQNHSEQGRHDNHPEQAAHHGSDVQFNAGTDQH